MRKRKINNRDLSPDILAKAQAILDDMVAKGIVWKGADGRYRHIDEISKTRQ